MSDKLLADAAIRELQKEHAKPFFIACGLFHPHYPWYVPQKYLDLYPLDEIALPPIKENDLSDASPVARKLCSDDWDRRIQDHGLVKESMRGYLASVSFSDAHMGRILDALEKSPHRDNTIVILLSIASSATWTAPPSCTI